MTSCRNNFFRVLVAPVRIFHNFDNSLSNYNRTFTLDVKSVLNKNLIGILGGTQCEMGDSRMLSEC
jgi:hypothetical protein